MARSEHQPETAFGSKRSSIAIPSDDIGVLHTCRDVSDEAQSEDRFADPPPTTFLGHVAVSENAANLKIWLSNHLPRTETLSGCAQSAETMPARAVALANGKTMR